MQRLCCAFWQNFKPLFRPESQNKSLPIWITGPQATAKVHQVAEILVVFDTLDDKDVSTSKREFSDLEPAYFAAASLGTWRVALMLSYR